MYVIEVIPLRKGTHINTLTYFSGQEYKHGSILKVPLRNSYVLGVAIKSEPVSATKTAIKAATFSLKKLPPQENLQSLSSSYIKTAEEVANLYACNTSNVLYAMLPPEIKNGDMELPHTHHVKAEEKFQPEILQGTRKERYLAYLSLVRETFAHSGSVQIVVPSSIEAENVMEALSSGIEDRIILLTSTMTKKKICDAYEKLGDYSKAKLIITTTSYSTIERHDITTMIIEHASSSYFNGRTRPYIDHRILLRIYAHNTGRRIIFCDILPKSEEEAARRDGTYITFGETPKRLELPGKLRVVNMKDTHNASNVFHLFSQEIINAIKDTKKKKGKSFIFAARRGLSPVVACIDCGYIFRSPNTGAPYSLIRTNKNGVEERWFVCNSSGARERAHDTCPKCTSWRLRERGIGIQAVYDELISTLKDTPIILFDYTTANTFKKTLFLLDKFYKTKGAIMLGTQMAVPYLTKPINTSVVVSMDALSATPTWRLQEENFSLLLSLREQTSGTVYIQTRSEEKTLINLARKGSVEAFYNEELELRKTFNYPPFTTFIHLTWRGNKTEVEELESFLKKLFKNYTTNTYNAPPTPKGAHIKYCLIRIASKDWPDNKLIKKIKSLPPSIRIMINPDRIV